MQEDDHHPRSFLSLVIAQRNGMRGGMGRENRNCVRTECVETSLARTCSKSILREDRVENEKLPLRCARVVKELKIHTAIFLFFSYSELMPEICRNLLSCERRKQKRTPGLYLHLTLPGHKDLVGVKVMSLLRTGGLCLKTQNSQEQRPKVSASQ